MEKKQYAPSPRRIPELDGLRVLLVFIVSWYHFWQQSWLTPYIGNYSLDYLVRAGYMPVDGTILLSGFLLFLPYARSMVMGDPLPDRRWFYRRRVMRIVPSFYFITLAMLFIVALPWNLYYKPQDMVKDLFMHATFTFTFDSYTYISTPIGVASWTLAIEMQAYLLFPFLAKWCMKRPTATMLGMTALSWLWRGYCLWTFSDYNMVVNQLPSFLDVYALGMAASLLYVRLTQAWKKVKRPMVWQVLATAVFVVCILALEKLLKAQAGSGSFSNIQAGQMIRRFPMATLLCGVAVALPFTVLPLRKLMGNRVMTFLAGISMNYYLIHQNLAVHLKRLGIPYSEFELPNQAGDRPWMYQYTFLCFGLSLLLAILVTYLVEKPGSRLLKRLFEKQDQRRKERLAPAAAALKDTLQPGDVVILSNLSAPAKEAVVGAMADRSSIVVQEGLSAERFDTQRHDPQA